jgi:hypothetical protein
MELLADQRELPGLHYRQQPVQRYAKPEVAAMSLPQLDEKPPAP